MIQWRPPARQLPHLKLCRLAAMQSAVQYPHHAEHGRRPTCRIDACSRLSQYALSTFWASFCKLGCYDAPSPRVPCGVNVFRRYLERCKLEVHRTAHSILHRTLCATIWALACTVAIEGGPALHW